MFKDVFVLRKNAWHSRLMHYIWGLRYHDFSHICPYFWLSIFNVIISPIFLPLKFTFWTLIPRYMAIPAWRFFKWSCNKLEQWGQHLGDEYNKWCEKQQEKYKQELIDEMIKREEAAMKRVRDIPERIITILEKPSQDYRDRSNLNDYVYLKTKGLGKKKAKRWRDWWHTFLDLHRINPDAFTGLINKKKEEIKEEEERVNKIVEALKAVNNTTAPSDGLTRPAPEMRPETEEEKIKRERREQKEEQKEQKRQEKLDKKEEKRLEREAKKKERDEKRRQYRELKAQEREEKRKKREAYKADQRIRNKQRINKILKIVKPISVVFIWLIGNAAATVGLILLVKGIKLLNAALGTVKHSTYVSIGSVLKTILIWGGLAVAAFFVIWSLILIFRRIKLPKIRIKLPRIKIPFPEVNMSSVSIPKVKIPVNKVVVKPFVGTMKYIWKIIKLSAKYFVWPFVKVAKGIRSFSIILVQTIKNNCPAIHWKD